VKIQQMTKYILGGTIAVGLTFLCASSNAQAKEKKMNEALTINRDGAQRCGSDRDRMPLFAAQETKSIKTRTLGGT
jgi:hypothetical protein